jgi:hypothetical protein
MSELDWEEPPSARIPPAPLVRNWIGPAYRDWTRALYPPRRGVTVVWGCFFIIPWAIVQTVKFWVWAIGIVCVTAVAVFWWIPYELATYRHRRKLALRRVLLEWQRYMTELHHEDPPPPLAA